ncbi:MAG TPA: hypothetical protein VHL59_17325, partial [Thermoanaerobaculia bacterium]|nr:hypothetical protein [Thermoanaerobaculia bacterium]
TRSVIRNDESFGDHHELLTYVIEQLVRQTRHREVEALIAEEPIKYEGRAWARTVFVQHLIASGRLDEAARAAEPLRSGPENPSDHRRPLAFARLGAAFARAGRRAEAENALRYAVSRMPALLNEYERDQIDAVRAPAEAALGRFREARLIADGIEDDRRQWEAYFALLDVYVTLKKSDGPGEE